MSLSIYVETESIALPSLEPHKEMLPQAWEY